MGDIIFHQNMRTYSGACAATKQAKLDRQFTTIGGRAKSKVVAAGFTEIRNWSDLTEKKCVELASCLDDEIAHAAVIPVGATGKTWEYIAITWHPDFAATHSGFTILQSYPRQYLCVATDKPETRLTVPSISYISDNRGIAFIYGTYAGDVTLIAFMHNMYANGSRFANFDDIPKMLTAINTYLKANGKAEPKNIYIGGDFNVAPKTLSSKFGDTSCVASKMANGKDYENTTNSNCYDYWLTNNTTLTDSDAMVWGQTREPAKSSGTAASSSSGASDHAGISLSLTHTEMRD